LSGSQPAGTAQIDKGISLGLQHAQSVEFSSMLASDQGLQLASVKAVAAPYPLRGELKSTPRRFAEEQAGGLPQPGESGPRHVSPRPWASSPELGSR